MARFNSAATNFADCMTIGEAAEFLGVSTATLRNWDRSGKLKPRRHPQNGYRIYLHDDLQGVLHSAELPGLDDDLPASGTDWSKLGESEHFVQFYERDEYLMDCVAAFIGEALHHGDCAVAVATPEHREELQRRLAADGIDVDEALAAGRYVALDAREVLSQLLVNRKVDTGRFQMGIGPLVAQLAETGRRVHAFGEMVALLWSDGNREAAIALEQLWSDFSKRHHFTILCAYPIDSFNRSDHFEAFSTICNCHSRVIPAESYSDSADCDERLRKISMLQQQAHSLRAEIKHRQVVESALSRRERKLADFFENAIEGLHKVGSDGTILWANKADYELLGYAEDEYVGHSIRDFHVDQEVIDSILQRLSRGEALANFPAKLRGKDGSVKHVLISSNAFIENDELLYTRCFTRDVTELRLAEKKLEESNRRRDQFLATLSEELHSPLPPISEALDLLDHSGGNPEMTREAANVIRRQLSHLTGLADGLLDISRTARDQLSLNSQSVELGSIVSAAVDSSRPAIQAAGLHLQISISEQPVRLHADPERLAQVFCHLLHNAAKFTPSGGVIAIDSRQVEREAVISIRDNGVGISQEALACVFDMFRPVDDSLAQPACGQRIGLTLVRRLVELHEGTVHAQSEGPGKGSEFTVRLPVSDATRETKSRRPAKEAPLVKRRILVVDDNKDSGDTMCILLRHKGHEVWTARDGLEAVAKAGELEPDIILMDLGMPKLNGYDATRRIRETKSGQNTFIVALTGWSTPDDIAKSIEAGCSAHLVKPVDFAALDELLASAPTGA